MKTKPKSLGELLSDAEDKVYGDHQLMWRFQPPSARKDYQRIAKLFLASLPEGYHELTSPAIASKAAKALRSKRTSKAGKAIAGSALTQARNRRAAK